MEEMKGFVQFEDKNYPFAFSNEKLELYPDEVVQHSLADLFSALATFERGKTYEDIELHGITSNRNNVIFEVSEKHSDHEGFLTFNVFSVYVYDPIRYEYYTEDGKRKHRTKETTIRGIKLRGLDVDLFYPPESAYSIEHIFDGSIRTNVGVKNIIDIPLGTIEWDGINVAFTANHMVAQSVSSSPLHSSSVIVATFSDAVSLNYVKDIYASVYQTFRYICRRNNIVFDDIEVFDIDEGLRKKFGKYYDFRRHHVNENNKNMKRRVLSYDYLGDGFAKLVRVFLDGVIYIDHLPDNIDKANTFGPDRMLFDFVAFEREYANLYPEVEVRSNSYMEAKQAALEAIGELVAQKTGKVKKYLSSFHKRIAADENSLAERLLFTIRSCEAIMKPFLIYELGNEYDIEVDEITPLENMTKKMNDLRNDMAHGNLDIQLDKWHIYGFSIIETLLYVMRMKALGAEERKIQNGLIQLMGYNFTLKP